MDQQIKKMWYMYTMKYHSVIKIEGNLANWKTWMDLDGIK